MPDFPKVSVIIPAYNAAATIADTVYSVLAQEYPVIEILVVNDGSTDLTAQLVERISAGIDAPGKSVSLLTQSNQGASAAKQAGLSAASGAYLQYLDADDLLSADKISAQVALLSEAPGAVAVCRTVHFFDGEEPGDGIAAEERLEDFPRDPCGFLLALYGGIAGLPAGMAQPNAFLIPAAVAKRAGAWDRSISPSPDEDGEYMCRAILAATEVIVSEGINYYRKFPHGRSLSGQVNEQLLRNLFYSTTLKYGHLRAACGTRSGEIDTAFFRSLFELRVRVYPQYPVLGDEIRAFLSTLKRPGKYWHRIGGKPINFIANVFSWKLARRLQTFRSTRT